MQAIKGFDRLTLEWLEPIITFGFEQQQNKKNFKSKGDFFFRMQSLLETPNGYIQREDKSTPYQGNKLKLYTRGEVQTSTSVKFGIVAEKDQGEPMFNNQIKAMDLLTGYLSWKPDKFLKQVIIGQYSMSGAQGLVLQTGASTFKSSSTTSTRNRQADYRSSLSSSEQGGLRGVLIAFEKKNLSFTPFISFRNIDARLDTLSNGAISISSIKTDGYHRTLTELSQRKNTNEFIYGIQTKYHLNNFILETGYLKYTLEYPLKNDTIIYNRNYFSGKKNENYWLAAEGNINSIHLFTELALNQDFKPAVVTGMLIPAKEIADITLSYRRIPINYRAPLGAPFSEASNPAGESGVYLGLTMDLPAKMTLSSYLDFFKNNWINSQTSAPNNGYDLLVVLKHQPSQQWENTFRYKYKNKEIDLITDTQSSSIGKRKQSQWRIQSRYKPSEKWIFTIRADLHNVTRPDKKNLPRGYYLGQDLSYQNEGKKWKITTRIALFDAQEYDNRIYAYEPDILYSFSTPAYYGKGSRWLILTKFILLPKLDLWARFSQWNYSNYESLGSSYSLINGNKKRELKFQIRKRF